MQLQLIDHKSYSVKEVFSANIVQLDAGDKKMFSPGETLSLQKEVPAMSVVQSFRATIIADDQCFRRVLPSKMQMYTQMNIHVSKTSEILYKKTLLRIRN